MSRKGIIKKWLAVLTAAACAVTFIPQVTFADEVILEDEAVAVDEFAGLDFDDVEAERDYEPDISKATEIKENTPVQGSAANDNYAIYKFIAPKTGRYVINGSSQDEPMEVKVFDGDKYVTRRTDGCYYTHFQNKTKLENAEVDLIGGIPSYIVVLPWKEPSAGICFEFTISLKDEITLTEIKDGKIIPAEVVFNKTYDGHFCNNEFMNLHNNSYIYHKLFYHFNVATPGTFTFHIEDDSSSLKSYKTNIVYTICTNPDDITKSKDEDISWQYHTHDKEGYNLYTHNTWLNTGDDSDEARISLLAGDYYLVIVGNIGTGYDHALNYKFSLKDFKPLKAGNKETLLIDTRLNGSNDEYDYKATGYGAYYEKEPMPVIETGKAYHGILTEDSRTDYYHFTLAKNGPLFMTLNPDDCIGKCYFTLDYWSENEGYKGRHEVLSTSDEYCATYAKPLEAVQLWNSYYEDPNIVYKEKKKEFMAGEYVLGIHPKCYHEDSEKIHLGESGQYKFTISTSSSGAKTKYASKISVSNPTVTLSENGFKDITVTVTPKDAEDTTVSYKAEPEGIVDILEADNSAQTAGATSYRLTAKKFGVVTITFTAAGADPNAKKPVSATCVVSVIEGKGNCPTIVKGQKINLADDDYFGKGIDIKNDKFVINSETKGIGSVSKGIFSAKKGGEVTIIRQVKVEGSKKPVDKESISFTIEAPKYHRDAAKKKDIKTKDIAKRGIEIDPDEMIDFDGATVRPNYYVCSDKKGLVEFDNETGTLKVLKSGTFKVTAYYGADVEKAQSTEKNALKEATKNAGKTEYTIKAKLPSLKDAKVKPNKAGGKDKTVKLSVSNVPKDITLKAEDWRAVKVLVSDDGTKSVTEEDAGFKLEPQSVKNSYSKCNVTIPADTPPQVFAVIVTVDGVEYESFITVQPLNK